MIRRLKSLFSRYVTAHMHVSTASSPIFDTTGEQIGWVDSIEASGGRLKVRGWIPASEVTLLVAGSQVSAKPTQRREDVAQATGGSAQVGFELALPCSWGTLRNSAAPGLLFEPLPGRPPIGPISLEGLDLAPELRKLALLFCRDALRALPAAVGWLATRDPAYRARVKRRLRLDPVSPAQQQIDPTLLAETATGVAEYAGGPEDPVTVIVPVYNAFDILGEMLDRLVQNSDLPLRIILIEDVSSDPRVRPFLRERVARMQRAGTHHLETVELLENDRNLGFIGSTNRGLSRALERGGEGPVVLLNSDAFLPADWTSRLIAPLLSDPQAASVTPMSNDAEIFSVPVACVPTALEPGQVDAIDAAARRLAPLPARPDVPTGVGFCMALARGWLNRFPELDPVFGQGYGEEVDWCQQVRAAGGRHLAIGNLFVEHRGGSSFGSAEKQARILHNNGIITSRWPDYDREIQDFLATDPFHTPRLALGLAWAGSLGTAPVPIYLAHSLGGGAEQWLAERILTDLEETGAAVVLRVGGPQRWQLALHTSGGIVSGTTEDFETVQRLLAPLEARRVVYSCGVGDPDPVELPERLLALGRGPDHRIEILFHDYFPLSPSYTLLDADGVYRGPLDAPRDDPAHCGRRSNGERVSLIEWQAAWGLLAQEAAELRVFSKSSAAEVAAVWPDLEDRIRVAPHSLGGSVGVVRKPSPGQAPVIGVLGNIGQQKGAALVQDLARRIGPPKRSAGPGLVLIGNIDPFYTLPDWMAVTGSYKREDIVRLAEMHGVTHWLIPSIWPETYSFTTREALATGLPVLAFDIGAQGEAVATAPNGCPLPFVPGEDLVGHILEAVLTSSQLRKEPA